GRTYDLPRPFFVLATQNPIEQEGTYPLPEAQLDRFMFDIRISYPKPHEELEIAKTTTADLEINVTKALTATEIQQLQQIVRRLPHHTPRAAGGGGDGHAADRRSRDQRDKGAEWAGNPATPADRATPADQRSRRHVCGQPGAIVAAGG